jgi:hypothetical protein
MSETHETVVEAIVTRTLENSEDGWDAADGQPDPEWLRRVVERAVRAGYDYAHSESAPEWEADELLNG